MRTPEEILERINKIAPDIHQEIVRKLAKKSWKNFLNEIRRVDPQVWFKAVNDQLSESDFKQLWNKYYPRTDRWGTIKHIAPKKKPLQPVKNARRVIVRLKGRPPDKLRLKDIRKEKRRHEAREHFKSELSVTHQGKKAWSYDFDKRIFNADLNEDWINRLENHPAVESVERDKPCYVMGQTVPYGITKIKAPEIHQYNKGAGIKVCVIDTGVDYTHPDLVDRYKGGRDCVNNDDDPRDDNGHGTHCSGTVCASDNSFGVIGVAPEADLYACKVLGNKGSGSSADVAAGIDWARTNGINVISMSLGGVYSQIRDDACIAAKASGIVICASSGNSGPGENTCKYPGKSESTICVGATDGNDVIANFSSRCSEVTVSAPGVGVYSTVMGGGYGYKSGTSMACPHVAGYACLLKLAFPDDTPDQIEQRMIDNAVDLGVAGHDTAYGWGRIDVTNAEVSYVEVADLRSEISHIGKESQWQFQTRLDPQWSLKSLIDAIGVVDFSFLTGLNPEWSLKSRIDAFKVVEYSFLTEQTPPEFLKTKIKVQHINPTWKFWTQIPDEWSLKSKIEIQKYLEYSFKAEFDPSTERRGFPEIEIWHPDFTAPMKTVFFNWVEKGVPRDIDFELWYGNRQYLEEADIIVGARSFGAAMGHGYDLVREGFFQVGEQGEEFISITDDIVFSAGRMKTNSKKGVVFRLSIPEGNTMAGVVFFEIMLAKQREFKYQDKVYNKGIFGREYEDSAGRIIARAHILP